MEHDYEFGLHFEQPSLPVPLIDAHQGMDLQIIPPYMRSAAENPLTQEQIDIRDKITQARNALMPFKN